jgi:hypothetical protein
MDAGRFKILKYNGEGVEPGTFDGTGIGDLPLVISANKSKDRSVVKQQMTLQGSEGELPQVIELQQEFVPLFVDNSLTEKRQVVGYYEPYNIDFSGYSNGQYIRYRFSDDDNWVSYSNSFDGSIINEDDPENALQLNGTEFSTDKYTQATDEYYSGGTSKYLWEMSFYYTEGDNNSYDGMPNVVYGFEPGYHYFYVDASDKPFTNDLTPADYVTAVCGVYVDTPVPTVNLHWKRISENQLEYWVTSEAHAGSMDVRVMLNNQVFTCTLVNGATTSEKYTTNYTTSAAVNPAILSSTEELITFQSTKITQEAEVPVNSISINGSEFVYGDSDIQAVLSPANTTQKNISWAISSGADYATLTPNTDDPSICNISFKATGGGVTVIAQSTDNKSIVGSRRFSVYSSPTGTWNISGEKVVNNTKNSATYSINWLNGTSATDCAWSIGLGDSYASINNNGVLTVKPGADNSTVIIRCAVDSTYKHYIVTVTYVPADVKFERENIHLSCDYGTFKLPYEYTGIKNPVVTVVGNMILTTDVEDNSNVITFNYATNPEQYAKTSTITVTGTRTDGLGEYSKSTTIIQDSFAAYLTPYWSLKALETIKADETSLIPTITDQNNIGYQVVSDDDWITPVDSGTSSPVYRLDFSHNTSLSARTGVVRLVDKKMSYNVGSVIKEDWAFMSEPNPSNGIPNGSNLSPTDVAGTSTFNLYRTSKLYYPKSSISSDTFSYVNMSPSNDYDTTYTVTMLSQPNAVEETRHVIGIYKSYPGTPTDEKTIIQNAYENKEYYSLNINLTDPILEPINIDLIDASGSVLQSTSSAPNLSGTENRASFANLEGGKSYSIRLSATGFDTKTQSVPPLNKDTTMDVYMNANSHRLYCYTTFGATTVVQLPNNQKFWTDTSNQPFIATATDSNLSDVIKQIDESTGRVEPIFGVSLFNAESRNPEIYSFIDFNLSGLQNSCTLQQVLDKVWPNRTGYVAVWCYFRDIATT